MQSIYQDRPCYEHPDTLLKTSPDGITGVCPEDGETYAYCFEPECTGVVLDELCSKCDESYERCEQCSTGIELRDNNKGSVCESCECMLCTGCWQNGHQFDEILTEFNITESEDVEEIFDYVSEKDRLVGFSETLCNECYFRIRTLIKEKQQA